MKKTCLALLVAGSFAGPVMAQETIIVSMCMDGAAAAPKDTEALGKFLEGPWQMTAAGTGFTTGVNIDTVTLGYNAATDSIQMGGGGPSLTLHPAIREDAPFDMPIESLTPDGLTPDEIEVLTGCRAPQRFWWEFGSGSRRSWGALMFYDNDAAVGFMANSAGGSRFVTLQRM